jgi:hypothetical protein
MTGHVYFAKAGDRIKIGFSTNVEKRLRALGTGSPQAIQLLGVMPGSKRLERTIHEDLKAHRQHREWFTDCSAVREALSRLPLEMPAPQEKVRQRRERPNYQPRGELSSVGSAMNAYLDDLVQRFDAGEATRDELRSAISLGYSVVAGLERSLAVD